MSTAKEPMWEEACAESSKKCNKLARKIPKWLRKTGPHSEIIISTRIRLARNLESHPFPGRANDEELERAVSSTFDALCELPIFKKLSCLDFRMLSRLDRKVMMERRLASREFVERDSPSLLILAKGELLSMMVNEEDHLRIQALQPGLNIKKAWRSISAFDKAMSEKLDYAFSAKFGYLTSCPTNTGTGMRVSIFIHLPATLMLKKMKRVIKKFSSRGIAMRGFYGEGSKVIGNIYQISNQLTLGRSEEEIIASVELVAGQLLDLERKSRETLLRNEKTLLEDQVWRAYGILKYARRINSIELLNLLSMIRVGQDLGIIKKWSQTLLNELMLTTQPGHLRKLQSKSRLSKAGDQLRAAMVRKKLSLQS